MQNFNERLKLLRHESGLSQFELAQKLGLSKSSVNMYERGEREPGLETLENIADFFNVDMDFLLGKSEHRSKNQWLKSFDFCLPQNTYGEEQKSAPSAVSGKEDDLDKELISRLVQLTPAEKEKVDAFVQGLLASR